MDLANIVQKFEVKNVDLVVLDQGIDTTSIYGRLQFYILAAIGEFERGIIRERIFPFFAYLKDIRKVICTTNAIESLNMSLRKVTKNRGSFPNDAAMCKRLYLALHNIAKKWTMPIRDWKAALNQFSIIFEGRLPVY
mgnify:CR=1 FL=1